MTISEQIEYLENRIQSDIDAMSPRDRCNYYQSLKEFERPKMTRSTFTNDDSIPPRIEIELVKGSK